MRLDVWMSGAGQPMDDMRHATPDFKVSARGNLNRWIGRILCLKKDLPDIDDLPAFQGKIFSQPGHDNLVVCRSDSPIDNNNVLIIDAGAMHRVAFYPHEIRRDRVGNDKVVYIQSFLLPIIGRRWESCMNWPGQKTHMAKDRRVIVHHFPLRRTEPLPLY